MSLRELETAIVIEEPSDEIKEAAARTVRAHAGADTDFILAMLGLAEEPADDAEETGANWSQCRHPRTAENTYVTPSTGRGRCLRCARDRDRERPPMSTLNHCKRGHLLEPGAFKVTKSGGRYCLVCKALREGSMCGNGLHEMTPENTYIRADGRRLCKTCHRASRRRLRRGTCVAGHPMVEGSYRVTAQGTRRCLACDEKRKQEMENRETCTAGHPWTAENRVVRKNGRLRCRECEEEYNRKRRGQGKTQA